MLIVQDLNILSPDAEEMGLGVPSKVGKTPKKHISGGKFSFTHTHNIPSPDTGARAHSKDRVRNPSPTKTQRKQISKRYRSHDLSMISDISSLGTLQDFGIGPYE